MSSLLRPVMGEAAKEGSEAASRVARAGACPSCKVGERKRLHRRANRTS